MATIRKRGERYQVQVRRRGSPDLSKTFVKKSDAEAWGRAMEIQHDRAGVICDARILERTTLGELVTRYRDEISAMKKCEAVERTLLNAFLRQDICQRSIASVTPSDFAAYRNERLKVVSASGFNREMSPLQHMFEIARVEWGIPIAENPVKLMRKPKNNAPRSRRLRPGEYEKLLHFAKARTVPYLEPAIIVAVETAMRRGEILRMKKEHLSMLDGRLLIPVTKNGKPRRVPLSDRALEALESLPETEDDRPLLGVSESAFKSTWRRVVDAGQFTDLHFHDLRHEAISRMFERGMTMPEIAAISGHSDFRMLARYAHASPDTHIWREER